MEKIRVSREEKRQESGGKKRTKGEKEKTAERTKLNERGIREGEDKARR